MGVCERLDDGGDAVATGFWPLGSIPSVSSLFVMPPDSFRIDCLAGVVAPLVITTWSATLYRLGTVWTRLRSTCLDNRALFSKPGHCRIRATCARRGTRQLEFIRFRSADGKRIRVLPELPEGGKIYQYISGLGEALAGVAALLLPGSPFAQKRPRDEALLHFACSIKRSTASTVPPLAYRTISTVSIQENDVPAWATSPKSKLGFRAIPLSSSFGPRHGATKLDAPSPTNFSFTYTPVPEGSGGAHSNTGLPENASANFKRMSTGYRRAATYRLWACGDIMS